jgi:hypothetical protein
MQYLLIGILFLVVCCACNDKAAQAEAAAAAEQARQDSLAHRLPPQVKKICLDTAWLRAQGFTYQLLRTANTMQWTIAYPTQLEELDAVTDATYIFTASSDTACSSLNMQLTSIALDLGKRQQELQIPEYYLLDLPALLSPNVQFDDYNFDGQTDISVFSSKSGNTNEVRYYFLYDIKKKQFTESPLFNQALSNASFDPTTKTISTTYSEGGGNGGTSLYHYVSNDSLLLLESTRQDFINALNAFIRIERKRLSDGTYAETMDTLLRAEIE